MDRRGFLRILGIGAATPLLTKVVGPFQFLDERPKQITVANLNPELEIPYKYGYGTINITNAILKDVYGPAIHDQLFSDMAIIRWLPEREPRGRMGNDSRFRRGNRESSSLYQIPHRTSNFKKGR